MNTNAHRPAAIALALAFTLAIWAPTLSPGGSAKAATISNAASERLVVATPSSIVLM